MIQYTISVSGGLQLAMTDNDITSLAAKTEQTIYLLFGYSYQLELNAEDIRREASLTFYDYFQNRCTNEFGPYDGDFDSYSCKNDDKKHIVNAIYSKMFAAIQSNTQRRY